ncbi:kinase-like domain-containing protein [Amanita rubescens]|nr:kinase-like domain-containing protein [Amanita rubescens]
MSNSGIRDADRKIRRLMLELISEKDILPRSLFITGVRIERDAASSAIGMGGFGRILKGEYLGHHVALKVLQTAHGTVSNLLRKDFCREALVWRSLANPHILPLLGVFEESSRLFLVSPYMPNGTLAQWRKNQSPPVTAELHRLMLEVAKGVQYIHSEGIVHGSLKGEDVLLDTNFHCQIIGFGSARHCDATAPGSDGLTLNSAAPELLGACDKCGQQDCNQCYDDSDRRESRKKKTTRSDVYAFGCLYYVIFFDVIPFQGIMDDRIIWLLTNGVRPERLKSPRMDDGTWDLIQSCWTSNPSKRPTMVEIVEYLDR